jgi:hypothetical protein
VAAEKVVDQAVASQNGPKDAATDEALTVTSDGIAGMSVLRGLMLYGAISVFAALYIDFMVSILNAKSGVKPAIDGTLIAAAAALSGVLGSAFALKIGVKPSSTTINSELADHESKAKAGKASRAAATIRKVLSLEPSSENAKSWPLTFGIWAYAVVAAAVAIVYIFNQNETPGTVKALAVTFGGYVIALVQTAYGMAKKAGE